MQHAKTAADAASATAVMAEPDYVATLGGHRLFVRDSHARRLAGDIAAQA